MSHILIVDDYPVLLNVLAIALGDEHEVLTANSGPEALFVLATNPIDLVITDFRMEGMNGMELIAMINNLYSAPMPGKPKLILYSATLTPTLTAKAMEMGVAACLPKPFDLNELKRVIQRVLREKN